MDETRVFKGFVSGLREGGHELCRNQKSQRIPLTESVRPKRTAHSHFPAEYMVNDGNVGECSRNTTHLVGCIVVMS